MKRIKLFAGVVLFALPIVLSLAAPSTARQNDSGSTQTDLEKAGYSCERVSVNFIECTKKGSPRYWCTDDGSCQQAFKIPVTPPSQLPGARRGDVLGTQDPPSWGTGIPGLKDRARF